MIPDARRISATRRWAMSEASLLAVITAIILFALNPSERGFSLATVVATGLAAIVYRAETRIIRRRQSVMSKPFPPSWEEILRLRIPYYASLEEPERQRFQHMVNIFLDEKPIYGVGCTIDDTCRLLVASSAIIPIFAFPAWEYTTLRKVLVRPEAFDADFLPGNASPTMALGMVGGGGLLDGVMILSLPELLSGYTQSAGKHNVGIHEFAHLIDQSNGSFDGIPATLPRECLRPWTTLVHDHLTHHTGKESGIPEYGYTNEAEFFAVVSEYFFQSPQELAIRDPKLYAFLERIFRQNMLGRSHSTKHLIALF